jgi:hypothetical protein
VDSRKGWWAFGLATVGVLWTAALIPGAFFFPAYSGESVSSTGAATHTTDTLVGVNGPWVVAPIAVLVVVSLGAWAGLHLSCARGSRGGRTVGSVAVGLLATAGLFTVGFLVLPAALLLAVAAALTPAGQAREM